MWTCVHTFSGKTKLLHDPHQSIELTAPMFTGMFGFVCKACGRCRNTSPKPAALCDSRPQLCGPIMTYMIAFWLEPLLQNLKINKYPSIMPPEHYTWQVLARVLVPIAASTQQVPVNYAPCTVYVASSSTGTCSGVI